MAEPAEQWVGVGAASGLLQAPEVVQRAVALPVAARAGVEAPAEEMAAAEWAAAAKATVESWVAVAEV